jgi:hypothetical protein
VKEEIMEDLRDHKALEVGKRDNIIMIEDMVIEIIERVDLEIIGMVEEEMTIGVEIIETLEVEMIEIHIEEDEVNKLRK